MNTWSSNNGLDLASILGRFGGGANAGGVAAPDLTGLLSTQVNAPLMQPGVASPTLAPTGSIANPGFMDGLLGYRGADGTQFNGWGGMALGAASGLMNGFIGLQQLGVAKDSLAQSKEQFNLNFGAQKKLTNSRLEDRQAARVAAGGSSYQSVGDYMKKNGI